MSVFWECFLSYAAFGTEKRDAEVYRNEKAVETQRPDGQKLRFIRSVYILGRAISTYLPAKPTTY